MLNVHLVCVESISKITSMTSPTLKWTFVVVHNSAFSTNKKRSIKRHVLGISTDIKDTRFVDISKKFMCNSKTSHICKKNLAGVK